METMDALLREAEAEYGHLCAGQVLGVHMAMSCAFPETSYYQVLPD
jgi:formylmethanofuran dehydrogenase subunit E